MPALILGLAALLLLMLGAKAFANADPRRLARLVKRVGGFVLVAVATILLITGRIGIALPLGLVGLALLGLGPLAGRFGRATPSSGQRSEVRSAYLAMSLDHDTGAVDGRVLAGRFAGAALASLDHEALRALHAEVRGDPDSLALLEAYLDRRHPAWREDFEPDPAAGQRRPPRPGALTEEEAYEVLGLRPGAGEAEIRQAHRSLMKRFHPDQGGSTYLAARINEAKEILLRKHRRDL